MGKIILASASPRRRELLSMLGVSGFLVIPSPAGEVSPGDAPPDDAVSRIALSKARAVAEMRPRDDIIIAADTLVYADGSPLGKPEDKRQAREMLRTLSGRAHSVYTGVAVITGGTEVVRAVKTDVYFREMTDAEIDAYIATGEPMDKAGAYGAQGKASVFIERIDGDFFNVIGLPLCTLYEILSGFGVKLL